MPIIWNDLTTFELAAGDINWPWQLVAEAFDEMDHLKIEAEGSWLPHPGLTETCGPDGAAGFSLKADQLVLETCRLGALIGKLGGSSAGLEAPAPAAAADTAAPAAFAIGCTCLVKLPANSHGPLFIGFNTIARPIKITSLKVSVKGSKLA